MIATAVWLSADRDRPDPTAKPGGVASPVALTHPPPPPPSSGARSSARVFLVAFLSYEVGAGGTASTSTIRAHASADFAHELLVPPQSATPGDPPPARLASIRIDPIAGHPRLILASGLAIRPSGPEPLSFVFAERDGRWLAIAPGE